MKLFILALLASCAFGLSSCSRTPEVSTTAPEATRLNKEAKMDDLMATEDYGEELITRLKQRGKVSEEQEALIKKIWSGYSLEGVDTEARRVILKKFREEVKQSVPGLPLNK